MSVLKFFPVALVFLGLASQLSVPMVLAQTSEAEAASALVTSENSVISAYQALSNASEAGANVSSLLVRLNDAGWFLSRAQIAFKSGDFDSALEYAVQCQEKLDGFAADADALKKNAVYEHYMDFLVNVAGPIVGIVSVVCLSLIIWFFLKREYGHAGSVVDESS
jgi:hypothetical protein